ncbi:MAG TPA: hypothetical protein VF791_15170 [Pyrinomonadaceae bacterium]
MPLLGWVRTEIYLPDLPAEPYRNLLEAFDQEFTYAFGGCTIMRGLDGSYLSQAGVKTPNRINLSYTDLPLALTTNFESVARYAGELQQVAFESLMEEAILVVVKQIYHSI